MQILLSEDKLEALNNLKKNKNDNFYNEFQNRVNRAYNDQLKDIRKVTPLIKVVQNVFIFINL